VGSGRGRGVWMGAVVSGEGVCGVWMGVVVSGESGRDREDDEVNIHIHCFMPPTNA
jgi:hypothetical protein